METARLPRSRLHYAHPLTQGEAAWLCVDPREASAVIEEPPSVSSELFDFAQGMPKVATEYLAQFDPDTRSCTQATRALGKMSSQEAKSRCVDPRDLYSPQVEDKLFLQLLLEMTQKSEFRCADQSPFDPAIFSEKPWNFTRFSNALLCWHAFAQSSGNSCLANTEIEGCL